MILHTFTLTLGSTRPIHGSAQELRGFFATKFNEYIELHQHNVDKFVYRYPVVQYKMIGHVPTVIGINEGAEVLKRIFDEYQEIRLGENTYQIVERGISLKDEEFGLSDKIHAYEFVTPWLALNQENYRKFYTLKGKAERDEFLRKILTGNHPLNRQNRSTTMCPARSSATRRCISGKTGLKMSASWYSPENSRQTS